MDAVNSLITRATFREIMPLRLGASMETHSLMVVDVPSYHHINPPVADLNARSAIILAIMLTNATIIMMIRLAQLLFSTLMGIVQSIPTDMLTPEPLIT